MQAGFREASRLMGSVTASVERRCLIWMAVRLPPWVGSDHLTGLALAAMFMAGLSYSVASTHRMALAAAVGWLAVNWFGDSLDGTLARVRQQQRPRYGFYVDHVIDCLGTSFLLAGLGLSGFMSPLVAMTALAVYLLLAAEVYLATYCLGAFRMSFWGVGATELRILLAIGTVALFGDPTVDVGGRAYRLFDVGGAVAIVAMLATVIVSAAQNTRALYRAEPLPARKTPPVRPEPQSTEVTPAFRLQPEPTGVVSGGSQEGQG
jgi:phosphatidylglycerophosphate synthase